MSAGRIPERPERGQPVIEGQSNGTRWPRDRAGRRNLSVKGWAAGILLALAALAWTLWCDLRAPGSLAAPPDAPLTTGTPTPTLAPGTGAIAGIGWQDLNANGLREEGEPPKTGIQLTLYNQAGQVLLTAVTDLDGSYRFSSLPAGGYRLVAAPPAGYQMTTESSYNMFIVAGAVLSLDFGVVFVPSPTPTATPIPQLDIRSATFVACGSVVQADTRAGRNNVSHYSCQPSWDERGPELVYRIELGRSQKLTATFLTTTVDLDLFLLPSPYPDTCLAAGDNYISHQVEPGIYFVSVDGYQGAEGAFSLRFDCPFGPYASPTPTSTIAPTATPTTTPTPSRTPSPTATNKPRLEYMPLLLSAYPTATPEPTILTFQQGSEGYTGAADTYLNRWATTQSYGDADVIYLRLHRQDQISTHMVPLLRFDLALLPAEAHVVSATLSLYVTSPPGGDDIVGEVHGLLRTWDETTATWEQPATGQQWATQGAQGAGADYMTAVSDSLYISAADRWYVFDVTGLVRTWVNEPGSNYGALLLAKAGQSEANQAAGFASRESATTALRPQLAVSYWVAEGRR